MNHKTKWLALLMCNALLLGGCGTVDDTPTPSTEQTVEATAPTVTPAPTEEPIPVAPILSITKEEQEWYTADGSTLLFAATDFTVDVKNEGFEQLESTLSKLHPGIQKTDFELLAQSAEEHYSFSSANDQTYFSSYYSTTNATLTRSDSSVVSLRVFYTDYSGGTHGMYAYAGETFDVESGKQLELADILKDAEGFYAKAIDYISDELYKTHGDELYPEYKEYVAATFEPNHVCYWYLDSTGIVIVYNPYEVGPYSIGAPEIVLPYSEFGSYMHKKYATPKGEVIARLSANYDISTLIGETENIMVEATNNEWYMLDIGVVAGEENDELGTFGSFRSGYVIKRADGRSFLIIVCDYMSDDFVNYVYEVTNGELTKCTELSGIYPSDTYVSAEKIEMNVQLNILGSYIAKVEYLLDENGQFMPSGDFFAIDATYPLTIMKKLPVTLDGTEATLSAGTDILLTGTNNVNEVHFKVVGSDQTGIIHYTLDEANPWIHQINGISEYEYFESLPYAG